MADTSRGVEQVGKVADGLCKQGQLQPPCRQAATLQAGSSAATPPPRSNYAAVTHQRAPAPGGPVTISSPLVKLCLLLPGEEATGYNSDFCELLGLLNLILCAFWRTLLAVHASRKGYQRG